MTIAELFLRLYHLLGWGRMMHEIKKGYAEAGWKVPDRNAHILLEHLVKRAEACTTKSRRMYGIYSSYPKWDTTVTIRRKAGHLPWLCYEMRVEGEDRSEWLHHMFRKGPEELGDFVSWGLEWRGFVHSKANVNWLHVFVTLIVAGIHLHEFDAVPE